MKTIQMNKGFSVLVDDEDFEYLSQFRWLANTTRNGYVYAVGQIDGTRNWMHRLLCGEHGLVVDHINGNTLDNRRCNLRSVTYSVNSRNTHTSPRSNTGVENITRNKRSGKFVVYSSARDGKRVYLGVYASLDDAVVAKKAYECIPVVKETIPALLTRIAVLEAENAALMLRRAA